MVCHPYILGDAQRQARGAKNEKWSQAKGNKIRKGYLTLAFSGAQERAKMLCHPCILGEPRRQAWGAKNEKWSQTKGNKMRSRCLTPAFSVVQKWAETLSDPWGAVRGAHWILASESINPRCTPLAGSPKQFGGPRGVGSLGALGEWLLRSRSKGVGFPGAVGIGSRGDGAVQAPARGDILPPTPLFISTAHFPPSMPALDRRIHAL